MFGVESGKRALSDPRVWGAILKGVLLSLGQVLRGRKPVPSLNPKGGRWGLPADFLIDHDGAVVAVKYGEHAYDQWSVDEVLTLARCQGGGFPPNDANVDSGALGRLTVLTMRKSARICARSTRHRR